MFDGDDKMDKNNKQVTDSDSSPGPFRKAKESIMNFFFEEEDDILFNFEENVVNTKTCRSVSNEEFLTSMKESKEKFECNFLVKGECALTKPGKIECSKEKCILQKILGER